MATLKSITLTNYRNHKNITIDFGGRDGKITGANRIGKTNIIEAYCYLLTDKLLGGSADIPSVKNHENTRAKVAVEGVFDTEDGEVTLRKEFYEKWVKPRGSVTEELQGHSTDYFVNGAKQARASDYADKLREKFGIPKDTNGLDAYQLMIDPFYFGEVICSSKDWKLARKTIIDIVGDVTPEEIYAKFPETEIAKGDLERQQYDDTDAKKAIRAEIEGYKKNISDAEVLFADFDKKEDVPEDELNKVKARHDELIAQIGKLKAGESNPYADEITTLQKELHGLQNEYQKVALAPVNHDRSEALRKKITAAMEKIDGIVRARKNNEADAQRYRQELEAKHALQQSYKIQLNNLEDEIKGILIEDTCPTCGQKLPEEKIEEAFNKKKADIIEAASSVREKAIANKKGIEETMRVLDALTQENFNEEAEALKSEVNRLDKELGEAIAEEQASIKKPDPAIEKRIAEINARLSEIEDLRSKGSADINSQVEVLQKELLDSDMILSKHYEYQREKERIESLKKFCETYRRSQADAEQRYWAVGEFVKAKLSLLDEHMASKFGEVRFQLIKENIKAGSYDEVCVPYIIDPSTSKHTATLFPDGSKSEQIFTGVQIIKAIRDAYSWDALPIVFDQGGELDGDTVVKVSSASDSQIIAVKVEGDSKTPSFHPFN